MVMHISRRVSAALLACALLWLPVPAGAAAFDRGLLDETVARAGRLGTLHALIVARGGQPAVERVFRGPGLDRPVNVKSVAKTVIAALVGVAIEHGLIESADQPIAALLGRLPGDADPRVRDITVGNLLAMQAGLERTSGQNYGRWVASRDWVAYALTRPFVDEPGGRMLYSTGNSHLLSAILTRVADRSTLAIARDWLGDPLDIEIPPWSRDPQGVYLGGNQMALSPRALLRLGETYRNGGLHDGTRVLPEAWIAESWRPRTVSPHTGHAYGYGWFVTAAHGHPVYYAWGYGGQMIYVVPSLAMTVVATSDPNSPAGRTGYLWQLHELVADGLIPAAERAAAALPAATPATLGGDLNARPDRAFP